MFTFNDKWSLLVFIYQNVVCFCTGEINIVKKINLTSMKYVVKYKYIDQDTSGHDLIVKIIRGCQNL